MVPSFCIEAAGDALELGRPEIFHTDQGFQFTSKAVLSVFEGLYVAISMDGRGRAHGNVFVAGLWRSEKYEELCLNDYGDG